MKTAYISLLAVTATLSLAAHAAPTTFDEARADAAQRNYAAAHAASLSPLPAAPAIHVTDGETARLANAQANTRRAHDAHIEATLQAGNGIKEKPVKVTDTDSARAAATQSNQEDVLLADYEDYKDMVAQGAIQPIVASK